MKAALSARWGVWILASFQFEAMYPFDQDVMSGLANPAAILSSGSALCSLADVACGLDGTRSLFRIQTERSCVSLQNTVKVYLPCGSVRKK